MNREAVLIALTPVTKRLEAEVLRLATTPRTTISIVGPAGSGKQTWARRLHGESARAAGPFVVLEPGVELNQALLASAAGGCLYLREVAQLSKPDQALLLQLLGSGDADQPRFIAASRRPLEDAVAADQLGEALEYRLNVLALQVPPLSERLGEIGALARLFLARGALELGLSCPELSAGAEASLAKRELPGNLHQLGWLLRGSLVGRLESGQEGPISEEELQKDHTSVGDKPHIGSSSLSLDELEEDAVRRALEACEGNRSLAARKLGIHRTTLYHKLRRFGL